MPDEYAIDRAEWTYCYERMTDGRSRRLPWAFVQFDGVGEERKYVVPLFSNPERISISEPSSGQAPPFREGPDESMAFAPFPYAARGGDVDELGKTCVHFFGGV